MIFLAPTVLADNFEVGAKHAIAVDVATGKFCMKKMLISQLKLAITKLLTTYLVYEAIHQGKFTLQTSVDISDYPYQLTVNPDASNVPLKLENILSKNY